MYEVINFIADVFIIDLNNYNMVLSIRWLATLDNIMSNYKKLLMSLKWQG